MLRSLKFIFALVFAGSILSACNSTEGKSSTTSTPAGGYGLIAGEVGTCSAKVFDNPNVVPLIVILTRNEKTYVTYDVSSDPGTTWYHFDVPVGRYKLSTTWPGSREYNFLVKFAKTSRIDIKAPCGPIYK